MSARSWTGAEHLPTDRGFLVATNHTTNLDPVTMCHFLWDNGFAPRIMAKHTLFKVPVLRRVLAGLEVIPVHRGAATGARSLDAAAEALERGECVLVFPEGTLTTDPDLWPMRAKTGTARLALETGAPVIPVVQWGVHQVMAPRGTLLRVVPRKTIQVLAGPPLQVEDLRGTPEAVHDVTARLVARLTDQVAQLRGENPPDGLWDPEAGTRVPR